MAKRKKATASLSQTIARAREKEKAKRQKAQAEKALRRFRPRKAERGQFVFVGPKGGRARASGKNRAILVKITRTGKKVIVRERKGKGKLAPVKFRSASSYNIGKIAGNAKAKQKFFAGRLQKQMEPRILTGENIRWERFVNSAQADLQRVRGNRKSNAVIQIKAKITVEFVDDGQQETHEFTFQWNAKALQQLSKENFAAFFWQTVYAEFAQRLRTGRQVTVGSFQRVERANAGKQTTPSKWTWKGKLWGKSAFFQVVIRRIEYQLFKLKIVNR